METRKPQPGKQRDPNFDNTSVLISSDDETTYGSTSINSGENSYEEITLNDAPTVEDYLVQLNNQSLEFEDKKIIIEKILDLLNENFFEEKEKINQPNCLYQLFRMDNTFAWQERASELRIAAWKTFIPTLKSFFAEEATNKNLIQDILKYAQTLAVFKDHSSNFFFTQNTNHPRSYNMLTEIMDEMTGKRPESLTVSLGLRKK